MTPHPLTYFDIKKYYQKEPKFNSVYSRNNLPKIKDWEYVINLDVFKSIGTHCIVLYVSGKNIIYFDSFVVEHTQKEIKKIRRNKNTITNFYKLPAYHSVRKCVDTFVLNFFILC